MPKKAARLNRPYRQPTRMSQEHIDAVGAQFLTPEFLREVIVDGMKNAMKEVSNAKKR